jgi:hypothetical protein
LIKKKEKGHIPFYKAMAISTFTYGSKIRNITKINQATKNEFAEIKFLKSVVG